MGFGRRQGLRQPPGYEFRILRDDGSWSEWMDTTRIVIAGTNGDTFARKISKSDNGCVFETTVDGVRREWRRKVSA